MQIKLIKKKNEYLAEIFQELDIKFAFVHKIDDNTYEQVTTPAKCRDFLGDVIWSKKSGKVACIYGFVYSFTENPYDLDKLRMSLTFPSLESMEHFKNNFDNLIFKEKKTGCKKFSEYKTTDDNMTLIIETDKTWQSASWKLSLYTFYIKCISYESLDKLKSPENNYIEILNPKVETKLLSKLKSRIDFIPEEIKQAHNFSGFVSICQNRNEYLCKKLLGA